MVLTIGIGKNVIQERAVIGKLNNLANFNNGNTENGTVVDDWKKLLMKTIHPKIAHFGMNCFHQQLLMALQQL